jgi:hypothetical protein
MSIFSQKSMVLEFGLLVDVFCASQQKRQLVVAHEVHFIGSYPWMVSLIGSGKTSRNK